MLDLGDVLYAPNCFTDGQGRNIMFGWLQELRKGGGFDYAGCLSVPRVVTHQGGYRQSGIPCDVLAPRARCAAALKLSQVAAVTFGIVSIK